MKLLLTGASGFIGSHFVPFFEKSGFEVHVMGRGEDAAAVFARVQPDFFIHLAARAVPGRDVREFVPQIEDTIQPTVVLAHAIPASTKLALFFGSSDEYGAGSAPFREDHRANPISPYGWAKNASHLAVRMIAEKRGLSYAWVRPFLIYGPGQRPGPVVASLVRGCKTGGPIDLTPGEQTRDFLFIDDLCAMVLTILRNHIKAAGQILNLCSSKPTSIRVVAEKVREICGRGELKFGAIPYRDNEIMSFYGSSEKFNTLFGEPKLTSLDDGLRKTIAAERAFL